MSEKKTIFSGVQPSGMLTLGNYIGALKNWVELQEEYECFYCVVDLHAITVRQNPAELRKRTMETLAIFLASGIDPEKSTIFMQSHVSAHAELGWILDCYTYLGELNRMTQFKQKSERHKDNINAGLYTYPVLQVADILLYQSDLVPVGEDQRQHIELTRDIAERFNNAYSPTFTIPEVYVPKVGARIMSLQEPDKKMSKSDENENAFIALGDEPDVIVRKLKRAVTDSDGEIRIGDDKPGVTNLLSIYAACSNCSLQDSVEHFSGKGYGDLKSETADAVVATLEPLQARYKQILVDKAYCNEVMQKGAEKAAQVANKTLSKVQKKIGLAPRIF